jgi:RNA polymerase subunit RPABC4/transcription elongation factor Spt4
VPIADFYIIFINDTVTSEGRINWTKTHEIGHILLNHHAIMEPILLKRRGLTDKQYDMLEREADWFAKLLLCHPLVLQKCGFNTVGTIMKVCGISEDAANNRLNDISRPLSIYNQYDSYISILFDSFANKKACGRCENNIFEVSTKYCLICGHTEFKKLELGGKEVVYDSIQLDYNKKVSICPQCENEEINLGVFCKICGTYLVNKCYGDIKYTDDGCGKLADGNARYCYECGKQTSFRLFDTLIAWDVEHKARNNPNPYPSQNLNEIGEDDDLPF